MKKRLERLTKAEEELMHMYWDKGKATVSELIAEMPDPKPPHSTISSITRILESKGFLDHEAFGRTYVYFPTVRKEEYSKFSVRNLVSSYFEGSMNELVSFLVKENDLSLSDLEEIKTKFEEE
jgi:BlaI family transcriptional regulator, penicillinase repressor